MFWAKNAIFKKCLVNQIQRIGLDRCIIRKEKDVDLRFAPALVCQFNSVR